MATPVDNEQAFAAERIRAIVEPFPGRLEFAIRLAVICALTTLVVEIYQTPEPALTAYVAFFVMKPDRATSVVISAVLLLLITLIVSTVLLITMQVIDAPLWRVVAMTLVSFCMLFAASASKLKPIAAIVALIAAYALDLLGTAHIGEIATRALLYAWLFVGIPAGVSIVVNLVAGPAPRRLAGRALAHRLRVGATLLRSPDENTRRLFLACLHEGAGEVPAWLKLAGAEKTSPAQDIAALKQATQATAAILAMLDVIAREPATPQTGRLCEHIAQTLDEMAAILQTGNYPVDITLAQIDGESALSPLVAAALAELRAALAGFAEPPPTALQPPPAAKSTGGFFVPDAFANPAHVQYALKTTAAAMFCYVVYSLLNWPGIHTCLITCYIVSLGTTAETVEKLTLRIVGCLIGAAAGIAAIVFLMPNVTSIGALMAIVFVATLFSGWIAAGSPRVSYIGFQIAFAFFLCVIQGPSPAFDMTTARDRVIGILFGNLVVAVVFTQIWPVSVAKRIDPAIAALLRRLAAMAGSDTQPRRWALAAEAQAALGAIEQDLDLSRYEPSSIRPAPGWLDRRRRVADAVALLQGPLLIDSAREPLAVAALASRLDRLAATFGPDTTGQATLPASEHADSPRYSGDAAKANALGATHALVDPFLARLEDAVNRPVEDENGRADYVRA
ncbi:putative membrane protein [Burkholderia sp. Ch1-1]|uniref:Transmembrane protein n=1 Tax=Paraburkholderia dioscoreae TaxID=2604047 RepID=A0A5Q4YXG0_9BURK|nr:MULTISPECIES: FUSC family protein [Paraburkholderia]EIF33438.1 putative membrane protein [Burkholderia sp. Ch1-1]MDR8395790.1 FUSC family protein [Paraburkholderia sp. USG1]VVD32292.1 Putative transmembrane protein [Paraburkholderia dioscoreae]